MPIRSKTRFLNTLRTEGHPERIGNPQPRQTPRRLAL
jgi:hypothetical protein